MVHQGAGWEVPPGLGVGAARLSLFVLSGSLVTVCDRVWCVVVTPLVATATATSRKLPYACALCVRAGYRIIIIYSNLAPCCLSACCPMLPAKYEYETKAKAGSSRDQQGHLAIIANKPTHGALPSYIIHHTQPAALRPRTVEDPTTPNHTTLHHHVNKCKWAVWAVCCMLRMPGARLGGQHRGQHGPQQPTRSTQHAARSTVLSSTVT